MHYYHYNFYAYYFLLLIVLINCIKAVIDYIHIKDEKMRKTKASYYDIFLSIVAGLGLLTGTFFHGILTDIPNSHSEEWVGKMSLISIIAFVLFIIQITFFIRSSNRRKIER